MVVIQIRHSRYEVSTRQLVDEPVAQVEVDGAELRVVEGDPGWEGLTEIVLDHPDTGESLTFETDPELWAMSLPSAFRTGDTKVSVEQVAKAEPVVAGGFAVAAGRR